MTVEDGDKSPTYANMKMLGFTDCTSSLSSPEELYKEFHTNMSQFREPPPYPGPPKQTNQSGLRQSFSGSETSTDVSLSSTENLSSSQRQEPQGEETQTQQTCHSYDLSNTSDSDYSILARLGMTTSGLELKAPPAPQIYVTGNTGVNMHGPHFATTPSSAMGMHGMQPPVNPSPSSSNFYVSSESGFSSASTSSSKLTIPDTGSNQNISLNGSMFSCDRSPNISSRQSTSNFSSPTSVSSYNSSTIYANYPQWTPTGAMDPVQFNQPPQFINSPHIGTSMGSPHMGSSVGSPMNQMLQQYVSILPPPPQYPGAHVPDILDQPEVTRRSYEVIGKHEIPGSRSQPDLSHFRDAQSNYLGMLKGAGSGSDNGSQKSLEQTLQEQPKFSGIDQIAVQATQMVDLLTEENTSLREKLALYDRKVSKLQKFELEIQKVHEAYEALVRSSRKREYLEAMMKKKYEEEIKAIKSMNMALISQLEDAGIAVPAKVTLASMEPVDSSMANLLAKHKELLSLKERQDMELEALKVTIQEQRAQIEILRNVQVNSAKIEESQRLQIIAEYDEQIQRELASIKAAYEKKEQTEKQIRQKLEHDLEHCRLHHTSLNISTTQSRGDGKKEMTAEVRRLLDEKEGKILQLEKELIMWKEQHLEESIRKLKLQETEGDLTPRLPPYEQATSGGMNTETLINEAKVDKLKQMEEVYQANRKVAELEASVKSLQSQLSEKESILRIYQRSPMTRSSSVHTIYCTPHHSPRPSLIASGSLSRQNSQEAAALLEVRHKKTGSTSALEAYSLASQDDLFEKIQNLKSESKSGSETEDSSGTVWQV